MRSETDVCYFHIPCTAPFNEVEMRVRQVTTPSHASLPPYHPPYTPRTRPELPEVTANLLSRFDRLLSSEVAVLELLSQLTRRLYCLDRRIAECIAATNNTITNGADSEHKPYELDATLVS